MTKNNNTGELNWDGVMRNAGIPEVDVPWVQARMGQVRLVDIREGFELNGDLGMIEGIEHVPMGALSGAVSAWDLNEALVLVCRSGARSGRAAIAMERAGFTHVVSLAGGMMDWNMRGLPVVRG